jgi:hypothetical protein
MTLVGTRCELAIYPPMTVAIPDIPRKRSPTEIVVFKANADFSRREIMQFDRDVFVQQKIKDHRPEVLAAMLKELLTRAKLKCFSRHPRTGARNIIDARRTLKLKWELPIVDVAASGGQQAEASSAKKIIRARLTVRGFKDTDRSNVDRCAGASSRCSQELLVSEAAGRGWDIATRYVSDCSSRSHLRRTCSAHRRTSPRSKLLSTI